MTITIEATDKIVEVNGVPARIWMGKTDQGVDCHLFVTRVAVSEDYPPEVHAAFREALRETRKPSTEVEMYPLRLVL